MQIGIVGLGRMGANMARRIMRAGHQVVGYDRDAKNVHALEASSNLQGVWRVDRHRAPSLIATQSLKCRGGIVQAS